MNNGQICIMEAGFRLTEVIHTLALSLANCFRWGNGRESGGVWIQYFATSQAVPIPHRHGADSVPLHHGIFTVQQKTILKM